jgi:hypothetical protein
MMVDQQHFRLNPTPRDLKTSRFEKEKKENC